MLTLTKGSSGLVLKESFKLIKTGRSCFWCKLAHTSMYMKEKYGDAVNELEFMLKAIIRETIAHISS
jgi:hypothetical protein